MFAPARQRWLCVLAGCALSVSAGCATYSDRMLEVRNASAAGDYSGAVGELNELLAVKSADRVPDRVRDEQGLVLLERGTMLQALGDHANSARDLQLADKELELLDLSGDAVGQIGKYVYSDSSGKYHTSPTEKLSLNGINMLNYLARGDLAGARVEAKRFTTMRNYLREFDPKHAHGTFGSYLAGFTHEMLGEPGPAVRYYDEALQLRRLETLREPAARLSELTGYTGRNLRAFLAEAGAAATRPSGPAGELLVVAAIGRVPHKEPKRIPIGAAVGIAGTYITGDLDILERSAFKVVVYPELVDSTSQFRQAQLRVDGRAVQMDLASDLGADLEKEYDEIKAQILGAAISRMIVRAGVAEGVRAAGQQSDSGGELLGTLLALLVEGTMVAADKPDTRSWQTLPRWIYVYRARVAAGRRQVQLSLGAGPGGQQSLEVDVPADGFAAVVVTAPR